MSRKPKNPQRRKMIWLSIVLAILLGPLMVPVSTSGTVSNVEAAGKDATFFKSLGIDIHYVQTPVRASCLIEGKTIILIHGFGANTFSWKPIQQSFSPCDTVIAYDRPAFGFTERPLSWKGLNPYSMAGQMQILDDLVTKFANGRKVVLIGHSAGGQVAAQYALDHASKVSNLILESPAILNGTPGAGMAWLTYVPQINHLGPALVASIATTGDALLESSFHDKSKLTGETYDGYHAPLKIKNWEFAFWEFSRADKTNDVASRLTEFEMPVLLITGDDDTVVETALTEKLATKMPKAKLVVVPNAGHLLHEEKPDVFKQIVAEFIG
jgi:pimeloyl-ACP methyl ester carboxylesterase